jgi:hypothetical protein
VIVRGAGCALLSAIKESSAFLGFQDVAAAGAMSAARVMCASLMLESAPFARALVIPVRLRVPKGTAQKVSTAERLSAGVLARVVGAAARPPVKRSPVEAITTQYVSLTWSRKSSVKQIQTVP